MVRPSVILSVRYRNHFPIVQFQNLAHIWNPHGMGHIFKTIWGAPNGFKGALFPFKMVLNGKGAPEAPEIWGADGAPNFFFFHRCLRQRVPKWAPEAPNFFFRHRRRRKLS